MRLCVIPARGGSKRIPKKNIRPFCGQPILAYAIQAAFGSECFDAILVSTDSLEIADIATQYGATAVMRSWETSTDDAPTVSVLLEVLAKYPQVPEMDIACCLYPTTPFVTPELLRQGANKLLGAPALHTVFPIVKYSHPTQRALRLYEYHVEFFNPDEALTRTQDLEPTYHDAGQFYWFRVPMLRASKTLIGEPSAGMVLPATQVQDIDTEEDWCLAELKYHHLHPAR